MVAVLVIAVVAVLLGLAVLLVYNRLVALRLACENSWGQIDVTLRQRHDLVPNLVAAVAGYAAHERTTLDGVVRARDAAVAADGAPAARRGAAEATLAGQIAVLQATAEAYPDLRATTSFRALQDQLVRIEDGLQITRRVYNDTVQTYNTAIARIPSNLVAAAFGFKPRAFFTADIGSGAAPVASFDGGTP